MVIVCPYCRHGMSVKDAKAGSYKPKCAKCGKRFALSIAADPAQPPRVAPLAEGPPPAETVPGLDATSPGADPSASTNKTQAGNLDATAASGGDTWSAADATSVWAPTTAALATAPQRAVEVTLPAAAQQIASPAALRGPHSFPARINGYRIVRELGRGAMGAVYLAKQTSLDREVALKTIQAQWASNPAFIARFTREAYAAAQLSHHNVVQIHDLGIDGDINFFSMEYVRGTSLDELVKQHGKLDVDAAVGYTLQAARGLEYAHNHGMVHRDVKPANLMLNEHGIVKVADLGLVKTPQLAEDDAAGAIGGAAADRPTAGNSSLAAATAEVTLANVAMGTPAYMAPEQSQNAAGVDHRADIYSLGCTLYVLLTGRPPFEGASALEVITKHRIEPVVRPEAIVKRVPAELSEIVLKMVAKQPSERFANLGQVIQALESFLGIQTTGTFLPREDQVQTVEDCAAKFQAAGAARLRTPLVLAFGVLGSVLFIAGLVWSLPVAAGAAAMGAAAIASYFVFSGWRERTYLFEKFRELVATARWADWATWLVGSLLAMVVLLVLGWLGVVLGMMLVGVLLGPVYYFLVDRRLACQRRESVEQMEQMLKSARIKGVNEAALQQFVSKYSGDHWEELFESLFGYESKLVARQAWGRSDKGRERPKFRAWREAVVRWIDRRVQASREERDRKLLQKVEEKGLQAQGLDLISARKQAQRMAEALVDEAAEARAVAAQPKQPTVIDPRLEAAKKRAKVKAMLAEAKSGAYQAKRRRLGGTMFSPLAFALGGKVRFLLGCLLLIGCGLWLRSNGLLSSENVERVGSAVRTSVQQGDAASLAEGAQVAAGNALKPLEVPVVGPLLSSINAGIAGFLLVTLGMFRGWKMSLFALPAAAIMVLGPGLGIPSLSPWEALHIGSLATGLLIAGVGLFLGRTREE